MSLKAMIWAFEQKCKTPIEKLLLIKICDNDDEETGLIEMPSKASLCNFACAIEPEVDEALMSLIASGYIRLQPINHPPYGIYFLQIGAKCH